MAWILFSVVLVAFSLQEASAIPLRDFYPYGADQGDELLPSNDDGSTGAISLTPPFHFFWQRSPNHFREFKFKIICTLLKIL